MYAIIESCGKQYKVSEGDVVYFEKLDKHFKGLKEKYIKYYGERYNCAVPNYKSLYKVFTNECDKYGILYNMKDIIKAYKKEIKDNEQISLF